MVGEMPITELISPQEALSLSQFITAGEIIIAMNLITTYLQQNPLSENFKWDIDLLIAYVYSTGRVQGIREERQKRKNSKNDRPRLAPENSISLT